VKSFQYGDACLPITNLGAEATGTDRIRITWKGEWNHIRYVAQIREKDEEEWFSYGTNLESQVVYDLESNTEYEIRVVPSCGALSGVSENTLTLKTLEQEVEDFNCGAEPNRPQIENREPIEQLQISDRITAAGFTVVITALSQQGDTYSGKGLIEVPLFNGAKVEAELHNIQVNTDKQLIAGNVVSVYNPKGPFIISLDQEEPALSEEGTGGQQNNDDEEDSFDDLPEPDINIESEIEDVVVDDDTGVITVTDSEGNETDIDPETADENEDGDIVIEDEEGNVYVVDEGGNVTQNQETSDTINETYESYDDLLIFTIEDIEYKNKDKYYTPITNEEILIKISKINSVEVKIKDLTYDLEGNKLQINDDYEIKLILNKDFLPNGRNILKVFDTDGNKISKLIIDVFRGPEIVFEQKDYFNGEYLFDDGFRFDVLEADYLDIEIGPKNDVYILPVIGLLKGQRATINIDVNKLKRDARFNDEDFEVVIRPEKSGFLTIDGKAELRLTGNELNDKKKYNFNCIKKH